MEIIHRASIVPSKKAISEYAAAGVSLHEGFCTFTFNEAQETWPEIQKLNKKYGILSMVVTKFSTEEKASASYLKMTSNWRSGYPEPSDDFGYRIKTYNNTKCENCGSGGIQMDSFFFKKPPKFSPRKVLQLNWVYDEFFVQKEIWEAIFSPLGIGMKPIKHVKSQQEIAGVVQLAIPDSSINLSLDAYPYEKCFKCKRKKYLPISRGFFPSIKEGTNMDIFKAADYFGDGHSASKAVIVSANFYRLICEKKLKGVSFAPLAPT